ncbi:MAG: helix-turn-helix domain-containing protein [Solirubrobacterales bacterium]
MEERLIARRIRKIRVEKELTLDEVAGRTGFTKSLISKIENHKVSPPVSTLARIAKALDVSLGELFSGVDDNPVKLVRRNERRQYTPEQNGNGQHFENLISGFRNQRMEPMIVTIDEPDRFQPQRFTHPGQEFLMVLSGSMKYACADEELVLNEGDALYFNAEYLHGPVPIPGQKVTYLSVLCS